MKIHLLIAILFCTILTHAEKYDHFYFEHLNNNDGLISDEVNASHQDANGFMWFATSEGLVRYDGYEFKSYKDHPHLGFLYGTDVKIIKSSKDGKLFICTSNGFYAFSEVLEPIYDFATQIINGFSVNDVHLGSDGYIYVSSNSGFYVIDPENKKVDLVKDSMKKYNLTVKIVEDSQGRIWVGNWGKGVLKLSPDRRSFSSYELFPSLKKDSPDNSIKSLFIDSNGFMWVGTWEGGLYVLDISSEEKPLLLKHFVDSSDANSIPSNIIHCISEDQYKGIWIATPFGAAVIRYALTNKSKVIKYGYDKGEGKISSNIIRHIYCDSSNLLWFSTKGGGINKLHIDRNKFEHFLIPDIDSNKGTQSVYAFEKDQQGRLMIGVLSLGFMVYDSNKKQFKRYNQLPEYKALNKKIALNTVTSFLWDKDSALWLGTRYNGVIRFDPNTGKYDLINNHTTHKKFWGKNVNTQYLDYDGTVWVGTEKALHHVNVSGTNQPYVSRIRFLDADSQPIRSVNISGFTRNHNGKILVATYSNGIFELENNNGQYRAIKWKTFNIQCKIISIYTDLSGRTWIGTKGKGIMYVEKNSNVLHSPLQDVNLYGDVIYGINQDEYYSMWLSTNKGLLKLWLQQGKIKIEKFSHRDGLQGNIFIPRSIYKDNSGHIYVGGYNGFNQFNPIKINANYSTPPIVLTDLMVEGERKAFFQTQDKLELNHINNDFSATFSALDYIHPEANQFAYMVEGVDKDWKYVSAKMRSINYSNLLPGQYVLKVKGSNNQGIWNEEYFELPIIVRPAPYKTWWAILLYITLIVGIIIFLFYQRLRIERINQKYQLELIDKQKNKKLHEYKLRFFTNISHELLTPLSIVSSVCENSIHKKKYTLDDNVVIQRNVNNLTRMIRQLLTFRKLESGNMSLKLEKGDISEFVSTNVNNFKALSEKRSMQFDIQIEPGVIGVFDREKMEIILHNLLSNAFKYTNDGRTVSCSLSWEEPAESIQIIVKDNGEGISEKAMNDLFTRFHRGDKRESKGGIGIGLNLTHNLVNILHGEIKVESKKGEGSEFTVKLPVISELYINSVDNTEEKTEVVEGLSNIEIGSEFNVEKSIPEGNYTILIAEDNDDFREVLQNTLSEYFKVLTAVDGKEALEIAKSSDIDLIVSDVMMPNMSGKELCSTVKSDINLSHIPIILLTAKTGDENRLSGYEAGADAYLEKPVVLKLLLVRISNLLKQREKFKQNVTSDVDLEPENVAVTPMDQKFIQDAKAQVEENLSNTEFTVKTMAENLHVTNSMLYRKIRSLAGLPPNEFIRNIRLKRAAQMLENKSFTISEVAYSCGFNDLGYFGVCFKKMYGKTPSVYQMEEETQKSER